MTANESYYTLKDYINTGIIGVTSAVVWFYLKTLVAEIKGMRSDLNKQAVTNENHEQRIISLEDSRDKHERTLNKVKSCHAIHHKELID